MEHACSLSGGTAQAHNIHGGEHDMLKDRLEEDDGVVGGEGVSL